MAIIDPTGIVTGIAVEAIMRGSERLWDVAHKRRHAPSPEEESAAFPRPIPGLPRHFVLPDAADRRLRECFANRDVKVILVDGPVGSGKRTLVAHQFHALQDSPGDGPDGLRPSRVLYVDLTLEVWPDDLKAGAAALAGADGFAESWAKSTTLEQRLRLVARARYPQPTLLWLAHVEALKEQGDEAWHRALPAFLEDVGAYADNLRVVLTSRAVPESLRAMPAGSYERVSLPIGLPPAECEDFLGAIAQGCEPLQHLTDADRAFFKEQTHANPMLMARVANALNMDGGETPWRVLVTGDAAKDIRTLWDSACSRLSPRQADVIHALAILGIPSDAPTVSAVAASAEELPGVRSALTRLVADGLVDESAATDGPLFSLLPSDRARAVGGIAPAEATRLHELAAERCAARLAQYTEQAKAETSYARFYRFEDPSWQSALTEWLWHQSFSPGNRRGCLELAHIFFGAFWWWDDYVEFPFVTGLLSRWRETQKDAADQHFTTLIESFRKAYPRGSLPDRSGRSAWDGALRALVEIRDALGLGDEADASDAGASAVSALTAFYLGEAYQWRPKESAAATESDYQNALQMFNRAQAGFASLTASSVTGSPMGVEYDWAVPYVLARKAILLDAANDHDAALDALRHGLSLVQSPAADGAGPGDEEPPEDDFEARAWLYRAAGDIFWAGDRRPEAWAAYGLLAWNAFLFQAIPPPSDGYSTASYADTAKHLAHRVNSLPRDEAGPVIAAFRALWTGWRETAGGAWPEADPAAGESGALPADAFLPPAAAEGDWDLERMCAVMMRNADSIRALAALQAGLASLHTAPLPRM
jgi:hypothetical protein